MNILIALLIIGGVLAFALFVFRTAFNIVSIAIIAIGIGITESVKYIYNNLHNRLHKR